MQLAECGEGLAAEERSGGSQPSSGNASRNVLTCANAFLDAVSNLAYYRDVTASELKRKLAKLGCTFEQGTKHLVVYYQGNRTLMPRHSSKEIKTGTYRGILSKLGIKE